VQFDLFQCVPGYDELTVARACARTMTIMSYDPDTLVATGRQTIADPPEQLAAEADHGECVEGGANWNRNAGRVRRGTLVVTDLITPWGSAQASDEPADGCGGAWGARLVRQTLHNLRRRFGDRDRDEQGAQDLLRTRPTPRP
jgi:hypothetical protein